MLHQPPPWVKLYSCLEIFSGRFHELDFIDMFSLEDLLHPFKLYLDQTVGFRPLHLLLEIPAKRITWAIISKHHTVRKEASAPAIPADLESADLESLHQELFPLLIKDLFHSIGLDPIKLIDLPDDGEERTISPSVPLAELLLRHEEVILSKITTMRKVAERSSSVLNGQSKRTLREGDQIPSIEEIFPSLLLTPPYLSCFFTTSHIDIPPVTFKMMKQHREKWATILKNADIPPQSPTYFRLSSSQVHTALFIALCDQSEASVSSRTSEVKLLLASSVEKAALQWNTTKLSFDDDDVCWTTEPSRRKLIHLSRTLVTIRSRPHNWIAIYHRKQQMDLSKRQHCGTSFPDADSQLEPNVLDHLFPFAQILDEWI